MLDVLSDSDTHLVAVMLICTVVWYSLAAGVVRLMLFTNVFHEANGGDDHQREMQRFNSVMFWALSPVMLPLVVMFIVGNTVVWFWSFGLVPPPWRNWSIKWNHLR